jgi:phosphoribosylanthranilate isomerase
MIDLKLKICGMREPANLLAVAAAAQPDYLGLIFYARSPRFAGQLAPAVLTALPSHVIRTGVFVNAEMAYIEAQVAAFGLGAIQLHGDEPPAFCQQVQTLGLPVLKAFAVDSHFNFAHLASYQADCDYFLFDTKGPQYGGNGQTFDWSVLANYEGTKPFFLSGGIGPEHLPALRQLALPSLYAVDVNSRFELGPGLKDVAKLAQFAAELRTHAAIPR